MTVSRHSAPILSVSSFERSAGLAHRRLIAFHAPGSVVLRMLSVISAAMLPERSVKLWLVGLLFLFMALSLVVVANLALG